MLRFPKPALIILLGVIFAGCQTYTSGLVQTAGRADEAVVLSNLRSIMTAENAYNVSNGSYGTFEQLTIPPQHLIAAMPIPNALEIARDVTSISTRLPTTST